MVQTSFYKNELLNKLLKIINLMNRVLFCTVKFIIYNCYKLTLTKQNY